MNIIIVGDGKVVLSQMPDANIDVTASLSKVFLYTVELDNDYVTIPSFVGLTLYEANKTATSLGLNLQIEGPIDLKSKVLTVVSQSLITGEKHKKGTVLKLKVLNTSYED